MEWKAIVIALAGYLQEIADETIDVDTQKKLNELIDKIHESL